MDQRRPRTPTSPECTVFIDGQCPLCAHEARMLRRLDKGRGRLNLIDFAAPDFDSSRIDRTHDELMREIHALDESGRVITGMEVFRQAYRAVGLGWLLAPTGWPVLHWVFDALYACFARVRPMLPGRRACQNGACAVPASSDGVR